MKDSPLNPGPPLWLVMLTAAMAGGMGWGIRGQYGHETGAMIAGVLVSLVLVFLFCPGNSSIRVIRAAALGTIAMGFGGSMTYGQTVGLTHDTPLVGNWEALRWGLLGLAIEGEIALREIAFGTCIHGGLQAFQDLRAVDRKLGARFGHARFDRVGPCRVDMAALKQGIALAHGALIAGGRRSV